MTRITDNRVKALEQLYGVHDGVGFEGRWRRFERVLATLPDAERQRRMDGFMDGCNEWQLLALATDNMEFANHPELPSPTEQEIATACEKAGLEPSK